MIVQVEVGDRNIPFTLDLESSRWRSDEGPEEADFPLVTTTDGERYELYSDGTFAENAGTTPIETVHESR